MNALKKTQEDLQKGRQKLDDMLQRLEREQVIAFFIWGVKPCLQHINWVCKDSANAMAVIVWDVY